MIIKSKLYDNIYKIVHLCPKNKNILKKFFNEDDIKKIYIRWDYVFQKIMDLYAYKNTDKNDNIEKNLIYLLDIISKDEESLNEIIEFYKRIRKGDYHYEFIMDDMPDLEMKFLYLIKNINEFTF